MSDINVGAITEALNDKMDRDAHNVQDPSAVIIEKQDPSANNNYTWYRKYSDGWVEQGGYLRFTSSAYVSYNLIVPMADEHYSLLINWYDSTAGASGVYGFNTAGKTTTTFMAKMGTSGTNTYFQWEVKGMAAS